MPSVEIWDVGLMITAKLDASQVSNEQPRVEPGELDQTSGDFSTIVD